MFLLMPSYADVSVVLQHHPPYIILGKFAHHALASHLTKIGHEALMSVLSEFFVIVIIRMTPHGTRRLSVATRSLPDLH